MSIGAKLINLSMRLAGIKKLYSLPDDVFLAKARKMNKSRGFFMPKDRKAHYEGALIFGKYHCLKVMRNGL